MPADGGLIQNFVRSLYSSRFYGEAAGLRMRSAVSNLVLLAMVLGLVTAIQWSGGVGRSLVEWNARVDAGLVPALQIHHGRLGVRGEQPFVRVEPGGLLIIDTTGVYQALPDSVTSGLLVLPDRAIFRPSAGVNRTYEFKGQHLDFWLDGEGLRKLRGVAVPAVLVLGTPLAFLYFALINLSLVLILVGAAILADRLFGNRVGLPFGVLLRLGLFIVTPVALAYKFIGLVAPGPAEAILPFYPAVTAFLLLGAVRQTAASASGESD